MSKVYLKQLSSISLLVT